MKKVGPSNKRKMMTPDEVADILSVAKITIYRLMSKRQIKFSKIGGRIRFKSEDIERYIEDSSTETMIKHF